MMKRNMILTVMVLVALLLAACGGSSAEDIPDTVEYTIEMHDGEEFKFEPDTLELWVGQEVTLHFVNMGEKDHEFMVGQEVNYDPGYPNAFDTDFFENIEPVVVQGMAMRDDQMIMAMGDDMSDDMDMSEEGDMEEGMDMDEEGDMEMEDDHEEGDDHAEDEHEEEGMEDMEMEDEHSEDEAAHTDDHHGYMVMATQDSPEATITFTVTEDMVGEWEFGCFEDDGQHYDDGMKGTLVVHEAPAS